MLFKLENAGYGEKQGEQIGQTERSAGSWSLDWTMLRAMPSISAPAKAGEAKSALRPKTGKRAHISKNMPRSYCFYIY
jgi:hypothetical protein